MPNGHDKNWIRLCAAINGFRGRYGRWPVRIRLHSLSLEDLRDHLFSKRDFARIRSKVELVPDDNAPMIAEDDTGASYNYGDEGFPLGVPKPSAAEWLEARPKPTKIQEFTVVVRKS